VLAEGNMDDGLWWSGQAQALVTAVLTCQQVVDSIIYEAEEILHSRLSKMMPR
jgi:nitronate monooxygenase